MKRLNKLIISAILILTGGIMACNKDLTETLHSDVSAQTYNYTDAYSAMGVVYINMRNFTSHTNYLMMQETSSDELVQPANASGWDDGGIYKQMHFHTWTSLTPQ